VDTRERRAAARKLERIDGILESVFGRVGFEKDDPLDALMWTILSQSTSDVNSLRAYEAMRRAFPTWQEVLEAPRARLKEVLRPGGLARTKSARIQGILRAIAETRGALNLDNLWDMATPDAEDYLLAFDGVGLKTTRCVLLFAMGRGVFPVDTHITRILKRVGVADPRASAEKVHEIVAPLVPEARCLTLHVNLIRHGRRTCHPRNPTCSTCEIRRCCNTWKRTRAAERS